MGNYKVFVNKSEAEIHFANVLEPPYNGFSRMPYANFTCDDNTVIKIQSKTKIESCMIRPLSYNIDFDFSEHEITVKLDKPLKFSVEINGSYKNNILIFANPKKNYKTTENVIRFGEGVTDAGIVEITEDNTTVIFDEGAYVEGKFNIHDCKNIKILGNGILCMEKYPRNGSQEFMNMFRIENCENVDIEDICAVDSVNWTCKVTGCKSVRINNMKIIGSRGNSDGIDICGSKDVTVENIFTRTWDDSFVLKAFDTGDVENVVFRDSVLWNDFARPIEVGVEIRAEHARNIVFENIDVIHSLTGYPIMGIHHGDRAIVSDIEFRNIRIEDAPGAQLFDVRITNSAWNTDDKMGRIENIRFSDIYLLEEQEILPSNSRIQGFSPENSIKGVTFENINLLGKFATTPEELRLNIMDYVDDVKFLYPEGCEKISMITTRLEVTKPFTLCKKCGKYKGTVRLTAENKSCETQDVDAYLKISPANAAEFEDKHIEARLKSGEATYFDYEITLPAGKYLFAVQSENINVSDCRLLEQFDLVLGCKEDAFDSFIYDWYGNKSSAIRLWASEGFLHVKSDYEKLTLYSAMPVPMEAGEVMFSVEETDFGEVSAVINGLHGAEPAPQLRCPAEITYVFKNEPKVKEIAVNEINGTADVPFEDLGVDKDCKNFWLEIEAKIPETEGHRYPFTMFRSVKPREIAHMFANVVIK